MASGLKAAARPVDRSSLTPFIRRGLLIIGGAGLAASFHWSYVAFLAPVWGYWGFGYRPPTPAEAIWMYALSVAPAFVIPAVVRRPSVFLMWVFYIVVYVPSIVTVALKPNLSFDRMELSVSLLGSFLLIRAAASLPLPRPRRDLVSSGMLHTVLLVIYIGSAVVIASAYSGRMRFVSFAEAHELRIEARYGVTSLAAAYLVPLLSNVFNPFLIATGLFRKRYLIVAAGIAGQIFLYSTAVMRTVVLSPLVMYAVFIVLKKAPRYAVVLMLASATLAITLLTALVATNPGVSQTPSTTASLVLMRTFGIPGLNTAVYADFFTKNPETYWSHVRGVSLLVEYPYSLAVPYVIGVHYFFSHEVSANAHFWAQDGIAALGRRGLFVISIFVAAVFWLIDASTTHLNSRFVIVFLGMFAMTLTNGSIFTNLLTGGLLVAILLLRATPSELSRLHRRPSFLRSIARDFLGLIRKGPAPGRRIDATEGSGR